MAFWQNRSISLVDMYIDNSEPTENVGNIHFSLEYDFENTTLILKIIQVRSTPPFLNFKYLKKKEHNLRYKTIQFRSFFNRLRCENTSITKTSVIRPFGFTVSKEIAYVIRPRWLPEQKNNIGNTTTQFQITSAGRITWTKYPPPLYWLPITRLPEANIHPLNTTIQFRDS